ncbi:threonine-phosphate decarboxylase CobD [Virgibacillus sp. MSJ-26]|uniref:threonine-phosphate decarboxylase CobD n=1 Tax=Virgibacillus sp. MSJ-26 TaxID=2841522 RepID=UPI001C11E50A|nr:threonine-phosphate decarboxylase CobD [Virgibacillus sp. MSJ-26]MBU5467165.1 threonine-phosphate decarboxylase CobD [Virgibacillus sp. MSJ-26]
MNLPLHGSNPNYLYHALNLTMPKNVIDFSVNVNPFGPPKSIKEKWEEWFSVIGDYPDPEGRELLRLIAESEGLPVSNILLGNGGAELITLIGRMLTNKHIGIIQPAFSEYEKVTKASGCQICHINLSAPDWKLDLNELSEVIINVDAIFLCHPNNPTGTIQSSEDIRHLLAICEANNCYLIIDEAFYDFYTDYVQLSHEIQNSDYLLIIRSLTKMYAIAGLRLGYVLANERVIKQLRAYQPEWSVNALALEAGKECINELSFVQKTQRFIQAERERVQTVLKETGYILSDSQVNFYLLKDPSLGNQRPLLKFLLKNGIVPRHTENFPGLAGEWLRFAVRLEKENNRLVEALSQWKQKD